MTATPWRSASLQLLSEPPFAKNAPLVVVPWSKFGTRRLYVTTRDGKHVGWVDLKTGRRSLAMPELAQAFDIAVSEAEDAPTEAPDSHTRRQELEEAIELALIAGHASLQAPESTPAELTESGPATPLEVWMADNQSDEPPALMRHAYRGKHAYSGWDLGAHGKRLVEDDQPVSPDPRWAHLNSRSVGDRASLPRRASFAR